ncbi:MAG: PilZ domain-containing protein [Candidatus Acidiferrales bacterium]
MPEPPYALRRTNPRVPFFADAEMSLEEGISVRAQVSELSSRGCYVDALQLVPVGSKMELNICYGPITCHVKGKVIYNHSGGGLGVFGMGVIFREMNPAQNEVIDSWVSQLAGRGRLTATGQNLSAPGVPYGKTLPPQI